MKRLRSGAVPAGYVPPASAYLVCYALCACLLPVGMFILVTAHTTRMLVLTRWFRDEEFVAYLLFWVSNLLLGAAVIALIVSVWSILNKAVERAQLRQTFLRVALGLAVLTVVLLAGQLAALSA